MELPMKKLFSSGAGLLCFTGCLHLFPLSGGRLSAGGGE